MILKIGPIYDMSSCSFKKKIPSVIRRPTFLLADGVISCRPWLQVIVGTGNPTT